MKKTEPFAAWRCNRCNLLTRSPKHPGRCVGCDCPEHRGLLDIDPEAHHPHGVWVKDDILHCPCCGHEDNIDGFDCLGADKDCVFCNSCQSELQL